MALIRDVKPTGSAEHGENDDLAYGFDFRNYGTPINPQCYIELEDDPETDLSLTMFTGTPTVVGTVVTTPRVSSVQRGVKYRLRCEASISGDVTANVYAVYAFLLGKR